MEFFLKNEIKAPIGIIISGIISILLVVFLGVVTGKFTLALIAMGFLFWSVIIFALSYFSQKNSR